MRILSRDLKILTMVARFKFLTSSQVQTLVFADNASLTPRDRALKRLLSDGYIKAIGRRSFGNSVDMRGVTPVIYALTTKGYRSIGVTERVTTRKGLSYIEHCLSVVDVVCDLRRQESAGLLRVVGFVTEPDTHIRIGGQYIRPDLTLQVEALQLGKRANIWLEVDQATQGDGVILDKLRRYARAYDSTSEGEPFYRVVFAVPDQDRRDALQWLIKDRAREHAALFSVVETGQFTSLFTAT